MGRTTRDGPLSEDDYLSILDMLRHRHIRLIAARPRNTVGECLGV